MNRFKNKMVKAVVFVIIERYGQKIRGLKHV